jgi:hypothetical protein
VTREIVDYSAQFVNLIGIISFILLSTPNQKKHIKSLIRNLLGNSPATDTCNELVALGFSVIYVRQITAKCSLPHGGKFLITLKYSEKCQEIFYLSSLNHIIIKVVAYRDLAGLQQY